MSGFRQELFVRAAILALVGLAFAIFGSAQADTYTYDTHGRLISVTYSNGSSVTYTYDAAGNRTAVSQTP